MLRMFRHTHTPTTPIPTTPMFITYYPHVAREVERVLTSTDDEVRQHYLLVAAHTTARYTAQSTPMHREDAS